MHDFKGKWITDDEFCGIMPRNVFHKQLQRTELACNEHRDRHILFRKRFFLPKPFSSAKIYISADDYYKLYINGRFVSQGPAPSYHFQYNYNVIDVSEFLNDGDNVIAVHTLYQGMINRVWVSGDGRHGLILDLDIDGDITVCSDESFLTAKHSAYSEIGVVGYDTQFLEQYDSRSETVGFERSDFDDSNWQNAKKCEYDDRSMTEQRSSSLVFEDKLPIVRKLDGDRLFIDFGSNYVGYLCMSARGHAGDTVTLRCGQELDESGRVRYELRAVCKYEETWVLADGESVLDQFDYKSFRYAEIDVPSGCEIFDVHMRVRHYPFKLKADIRQEYADSEDIRRIWELCINTQKYGVQEVIQDCMEREKGFYLGDGCYTALTHMVLTGDDSIVRKLIDDAFTTSFITDGLVTCMDCSFMQEIAEYPLILIYCVLWHYNVTHDIAYLKQNYPKSVSLLEAYRRDYESDGLISKLDKWCVVDWPDNFRQGYDVDITEGKVCSTPHVSINAYYIEAVNTVNKMAELIGEPPYRDVKPLTVAFENAFYDRDRHLFRDSPNTEHVCLLGNAFPFAFGLYPDAECRENIIKMFLKDGAHSMSFFGLFPILVGAVRCGRPDMIKAALLDGGAWLRMLDEDATTTFEGWGKDTKWNTSLFHLTLSYAALFISDANLNEIFEI